MANLKVGDTVYPLVGLVAEPRLKIGDEYLELTEDSNLAVNRPRLKLTKDGITRYPRDLFGTDVLAIEVYSQVGNDYSYDPDHGGDNWTDSFYLYEIQALDSTNAVVTGGTLSYASSSADLSSLSNAHDGSDTSLCIWTCTTGSDKTGSASVLLTFDSVVNLGSIDITWMRGNFSGRSKTTYFRYQLPDLTWVTFYSVGGNTGYSKRTTTVDLIPI
jgi:hypothetical protein